MKIYFKEKPTAEEVSKYEEKLNYFLKNLKAKVKIKLLDEPRRIETFINNEHTDTTYFWIDGVEVTTPEISIETFLFSQNLGHNEPAFDEKYAWNDAFDIQESIYSELKKKPSSPPDTKDPYWRLWDLK